MIYLYMLAVLAIFIFLLWSCVYLATALFSALHKAPYVNSKKEDLERIFKSLEAKKGHVLLDVGSSDGSVLFQICPKFELEGVGIEINPILHLTAKLKKILFHRNQPIAFKLGSLGSSKLESEFAKADLIYLYLFPELIDKVFKHLQELNFAHKTKRGLIVICHEFQAQHLNKFLIKVVYHPHSKTFIYRF